jgi:four helix bundle protein
MNDVVQKRADELKQRTKTFGLHVMQLVETLPRTRMGEVLGRQLLRCATSVGANYRAACRARSAADFISKIGVTEEEADESAYWLEMLLEGMEVDRRSIAPLLDEARALTAIFTASGRTAKRNSR